MTDGQNNSLMKYLEELNQWKKPVSFYHNNRIESRKNHKKKYKMDLGSKSFGDFTKAIVSLD